MLFFQAEDGIRDIGVTGVQTCALPIWRASRSRSLASRSTGSARQASRRCRKRRARSRRATAPSRSEGRRFGKECSTRWSPYHYKKIVHDQTQLFNIAKLHLSPPVPFYT